MPPKRKDSTHEATKIMADALKGVQPPACVSLDEVHMPFWHAITSARAEWTSVDLIHAANLARCMASIENETALLAKETSIILGGKNGTTKVMNPRVTVLEQLSRRATSISSKIQVHAGATMGESKQARGKNTAKRQAIEAMDAVEEDDLIARPH